jgi:hypothetical protein
MSSASNQHGNDREAEGTPAERPSSTYAHADKKAVTASPAAHDKAAQPAAGASPTISAPQAREDLDPISFQRNALTARLSDDERARIAKNLG